MSRICRIEAQCGRTVICPEDACPFWEPGGAVLDGRCAFDHLDLEGRADVAGELVRVKRLLERAPSLEDEHELRREFYRRLSNAD